MTKIVDEAQANVAAARAALIDTARELQQRLAPRTIARDAWESAKTKGADIAEEAVDVVRRRPVATGGLLAAIALFAARSPIKDGVVRLYDAMTSDDEEPEGKALQTSRRVRKPVNSQPKKAPRPARKPETE